MPYLIKHIKIVLSYSFLLLANATLCAQDHDISLSQKESILQKVNELIQAHYVFPEKAKQLTAALNDRLKEGHYNKFNKHQGFTDELSKDIRKLSNDYHFALNYTSKNNVSEKDRKKNWAQHQRFYNYGFSKLEILEGNIGYLKLDFIAEANRKMVKRVFQFFEHTNGMIIDLRDNSGGMREMVALLSTYFLKGKSTIAIVESKQYNKLKASKKIKTFSFIRKRRFTEIPLCLLINENTFSSAEFLAYTLQKANRAQIIGQTTGGGAHSIKRFVVMDSLMLAIPVENVISTYTQSNWESIGVTPDLQTSVVNTLVVGQIETLKKMKAKGLDSEHEYYQNIIEKLNKQKH